MYISLGNRPTLFGEFAERKSRAKQTYVVHDLVFREAQEVSLVC
jgi:hypothetical protein